jgi:hypothetical protein
LIEGYYETKGSRFDTHPPAAERYAKVRHALALAGLSRHCDLGATFAKVSAVVASELGTPWEGNEARFERSDLFCDFIARNLEHPVSYF